MKRIILLIAIICSVISAKAQFGAGGTPAITGRISGTVIDSLTKQPMDYATVSLYRSTGKSPITGMLTDEKGNFKLDNIHPGSYRIEVSFMGYPTKVVNGIETTPSKPDKNAGIIYVAPSTKTLKEVAIAGTTPLIENHIDKLVYNAEKDLTAAGGNATDVLQKVPLVSVDINGNVSLRGDQNVKVLINGKPSGAMAASVSDVLKTIPAAQIKTIEVITSPSAKYDAEGSGGIINIVTKQKNISGFSGSVSGGIGTRQNNGNINLNYNKNRFSFSANLGGNLTWPQTSTTNFNQQFTKIDTVTNQGYKRISTIKRYGSIGSITAGYDFNQYNNLSTTIRLNRGGFNNDGTQTNTVTNNQSTTLNKMYNNSTDQHNLFAGFDWDLDYVHKFKKEGHELDISGQWSHSIINTDYSNLYDAGSLPNQKSVNDGSNDEYTLQADYTLPISKLLKLEAGGKSIFRRLNSVYDVYQPDFIALDPNNTNTYDYNQNVYSGYSVLTFNLPKSYAILAGSRVEVTDITGNPTNAVQVLRPFTNTYTTYIPSLTLQKALDASQTLKLSYSKRITRPSITYLNPFINKSNIQSQSEGNPQLAPEVSQTVELNYNAFIKSSVVNLSVYYKHINGLIEGIASPISDTVNSSTVVKGTRTIYQNIGSNNSFGASFYGSINPIKILTIRGSATAYTYNPDPTGLYHLDATSTGTYIQYTVFGSGSVTLNGGFIAETYLIATSSRRTIQGTNPAFSLYAIGLRKQIFNKKASIGLNTVQPFSNYKYFNQNISSPGFVQTSSTQFPFRSFGLTFSYSFGKLTFSNPLEKKKGVNNDDLKQDEGSGGGAGGPGGASSGGAPGGRQ